MQARVSEKHAWGSEKPVGEIKLSSNNQLTGHKGSWWLYIRFKNRALCFPFLESYHTEPSTTTTTSSKWVYKNFYSYKPGTVVTLTQE